MVSETFPFLYKRRLLELFFLSANSVSPEFPVVFPCTGCRCGNVLVSERGVGVISEIPSLLPSTEGVASEPPLLWSPKLWRLH